MKEYKLNIDTRILELLGPNLYTNIYYVLAELIANAYDADARNVYITASEDAIRVEDDGHGMSYEEGDIDNYLHVAKESRKTSADSKTRSGTRPKMGRKGVGKLAALSVSREVDVLTVAKGEKSGFVLSRQPGKDNELEAIPDEEIVFDHVEGHGSAIVMRQPEYRLHKTIAAIERNLLKIFPIVGPDFRIHIDTGKDQSIIEDFDKSIMGELAALITLGEEYRELGPLVDGTIPDRKEDLVEAREPHVVPIKMTDKADVERDFFLEMKGWIGAYRSTRGRKVAMTDFPDNFISLFANGKMGEFNILPLVGQNKLIEVYIVGQLHVDLFEHSDLPDIALSNRQGYRTDDPRYQAVIDYVKSRLLPDIVAKRDKYGDILNAAKAMEKQAEQKQAEERLRNDVDSFRRKVSDGIVAALSVQEHETPESTVRDSVNEVLNANSIDVGLKAIVDSQKKKILISHTYGDKPLADVIYKMLLFNGVDGSDILYTNCDDGASRIPEGVNVFDYLQEFFVDSYSTRKPLVLFVTSENMRTSWGAITEVGASWITKADHKIFNILPYAPGLPLDIQKQWHVTNRTSPTAGDLSMTLKDADIFCEKIEDACGSLGYPIKSRAQNTAYLQTLIAVQ